MRAKTEGHPAMTHRCPFCGADPGTPCRAHRGRGRELTWPHSLRIRIDRPPTPAKQALCCQCGQLRTYKHASRAGRSYRREDEWRRRWIGQLKCSHCCAITTHALLIDPDASYRDDDERKQLLALGDRPRDKYERFTDLERLQRDYHDALPRNPYLHHRYWTSQAREAWQAGRRDVPALCGATMALNRDPDGPSSKKETSGQLAPDEVRDQEYEDADTGMWWMDMDCVDCLRVANADRLRRKRQLMRAWLFWIAERLYTHDATTIERLISTFREVWPTT